MHKLYALLICCFFISSCVATVDKKSNIVSPAAVSSGTPTIESPSEHTSGVPQKSTLPSSASQSGPAICPDLPRPAAVFQAENGEGYIFRHVASESECIVQFDPRIHRLLTLAADGVYYSTRETGEDPTNQKFIHYANDGTRAELPFFDPDDNIGYFVVSPSGSQVAWSVLRTAKTTEDEEIVVSELYSAKADGSQVRLLQSVDNAAEVKRGEPYIAWMIQPVRFTDEGDLLFAVHPAGRGGVWNAYTGQYSNLHRISVSGGDSTLVYECPADDHSDCIGDISPDNVYLAVTERESGEITVLRTDDGTSVATYTGPGKDYIGRPSFSPTGDLVFMSADVAEDQITIEQAYVSFVAKPYEQAAVTLVREPLIIWNWVDGQHVLYTAVGDQQTDPFKLSLVDLDGRLERLPETYAQFLGILPQ
jgi:hypothetical protein